MITVFTLCSANYLAQAKTLGDSLIRHNPSYKFVIGLVDRIDNKITSDYWEPYELIEVEDLKIPKFDRMRKQYNIVELNTAVKPFYLEYLYQREPQVSSVVYIDPDIVIYENFKELEEKLKEYNIILTPHSCTVNNASINITYEIAMLRTGIYNLGFIATSRSKEIFRFLAWWKYRMQNYCFYRPGTGLFVDQIWANFIPLYFEKVYVEKHPGYNVCYWNHFERIISFKNNKYWINEEHELIFYHFSSYNPLKPDLIAHRGNQQSFANRPDLKNLFENYKNDLLNNNYEQLIQLKWDLKLDKNLQSSQSKTVAKKILQVISSKLSPQLRNLIRKINQLILESI